MNNSLRIALLISLFLGLAGCGAKGPLILPEKATPIEAPADEPTDNTPQIEAPATPAEQVPEQAEDQADEQAEDAVETPATPAPNG
jgi:predicted small lipoprotein YifL